MSLINEALKRTRDATPPGGGLAPANAPRYHLAPTDPPVPAATPVPPPLPIPPRIPAPSRKPDSRRAGSYVALVVAAVVAAAAGVGAAMLLHFRSASPAIASPRTMTPAVAAAPKAAVAPADAVKPSAPAAPAARSVTTPAAPAPAPGADTTAVEARLLARVMEKLKAQSPPAPPPPPPVLRLQGITSGGRIQEAMINGSTVRTGDVIEGAKITAIEDHQVRLKFGDQELILRLQ